VIGYVAKSDISTTFVSDKDSLSGRFIKQIWSSKLCRGIFDMPCFHCLW